MVDRLRLRALLERIDTEVVLLRETAARNDEALRSDRIALHAVKYAFVVAIEAAADAAHHVIASERLRTPDSLADSFAVLATAGFLPGELAPVLADMAGFRNLLVHGYAKVDDRRVIEILRTGPSDLEAFRRALAASTLRD
jgi:uncharacterized protein YutE (UPF0331/DUF86 family)